MSQSSYGLEIARRCITRGEWQSLNQLVADVNSPNISLKNQALVVLADTMSAFADLLTNMQDVGWVTFTKGSPASRWEAVYAVGAGPDKISRVLQSQIDSINQLRRKIPTVMAGLILTRLDQRENVAPPTPVAVVSMPARKTTTEIARDTDGNIASTLQVEADF